MNNFRMDPDLTHHIGGEGRDFLLELDAWDDERIAYQDVWEPLGSHFFTQLTSRPQTEAKVNSHETCVCNQPGPSLLRNGAG